MTSAFFFASFTLYALFQTHGPPHHPLNKLGILLPQDLCTGFLLCPEYHSLIDLLGLLHLQLKASRFRAETPSKTADPFILYLRGWQMTGSPVAEIPVRFVNNNNV